jgi:hypothetical protein
MASRYTAQHRPKLVAAARIGGTPRCWALRVAHVDRLGAVVPDGTNRRSSVAQIAAEVLGSRGVDFASAVPAKGWTNATWLAGEFVIRVAPTAGPADLLREAALVARLPVQVGYPEIIDAGVLYGHEWVLTQRILGQSLLDVWSTLDWNQRASAIEQVWAKAEYVHRLDVSSAAPYVRPRSRSSPNLRLEPGRRCIGSSRPGC